MAKHSKLIFEYSQITPQIYIGTNQCCVVDFKRELIDKGVRADISLEEKKIDAPFGAEYYLWMPVKDHSAPNFRQFDVGTRFIDQLIKDGEKVYIHCEHGHGRAPTLVAAYLAVYKNMSVDKALKIIKEKRPGAHPNARQIAAVKQFINRFEVRSAII